MEISHRHMLSAVILLLFLVSIVITVLPWQFFELMRFTHQSKPIDQLLAAHPNITVARKVTKGKRKEEKREEGLARARASMRLRRAVLADQRTILTPQNHDADIPAGAVYRNPRLFYQ